MNCIALKWLAGLRANLLCIRTRFHGNAFELSRHRRRFLIICFISGFGRAQLGIKCLCIGSVHHFNAHFRIFQCFRTCLENIIIVNVESHFSSYVRWCCSAFRLIVSLVSFFFFQFVCFDCVLQFVKGPKYNLYWLATFLSTFGNYTSSTKHLASFRCESLSQFDAIMFNSEEIHYQCHFVTLSLWHYHFHLQNERKWRKPNGQRKLSKMVLCNAGSVEIANFNNIHAIEWFICVFLFSTLKNITNESNKK